MQTEGPSSRVVAAVRDASVAGSGGQTRAFGARRGHWGGRSHLGQGQTGVRRQAREELGWPGGLQSGEGCGPQRVSNCRQVLKAAAVPEGRAGAWRLWWWCAEGRAGAMGTGLEVGLLAGLWAGWARLDLLWGRHSLHALSHQGMGRNLFCSCSGLSWGLLGLEGPWACMDCGTPVPMDLRHCRCQRSLAGC